MNEARRAKKVRVPNKVEDYAFVQGEPKEALQDVFLLNKKADECTLLNHIAMLKSDQLRVFTNIASHLKHLKAHEQSTCSYSSLKPMQVLLSGVDGTGKSFWIHTICAQITEIWKDIPDALTCAI